MQTVICPADFPFFPLTRFTDESILMNGPCAKTTVRCTLTSTTGEVFVGENWCENPQAKCPRQPGEDYTKCKTVCRQEGHAEVVALRLAAGKTEGSTAVITGHTYACRDCQEAMFARGVRMFGVQA